MTDIGDLVSPSYRQQLQEMHGDKRWNGSCIPHIPGINKLAIKVKAESILDYGCGPGLLKRFMPWLDVREYDPGVVGKDGLPEPADLVVCIDVLEHIEPDKIKAVLAHLHFLARKAGFATVATRRAKKRLPDGRNAHLIIQPWLWWQSQLREAGFKVGVRSVDNQLAIFWLGRAE